METLGSGRRIFKLERFFLTRQICLIWIISNSLTTEQGGTKCGQWSPDKGDFFLKLWESFRPLIHVLSIISWIKFPWRHPANCASLQQYTIVRTRTCLPSDCSQESSKSETLCWARPRLGNAHNLSISYLPSSISTISELMTQNRNMRIWEWSWETPPSWLVAGPMMQGTWKNLNFKY